MDSESLVLAIDQGGHASRALVYDYQGEKVAEAVADVQTLRRPDGQVELDADSVAESVAEAIEGAVGQLGSRRSRLVAAALAAQRSSVVCWDRVSGAVLSPVLSWQDRRGQPYLDGFLERAAWAREVTGLVLSPHYGASKLRWCLDHLPAVRRALDGGRLAMGPLTSFLLYRLLRERPCVIDPATAGRTLLWSLRERRWSPELLEQFQIPERVLPACVPSRHAYGHIDIGGLNLPLEVVTGDQAAALYAAGTPREDTVYINVGTGAFALRPCVKDPGRAGGLLVGAALQEGTSWLFALEGTVNGAGSALKELEGEAGVELGPRLEEAMSRTARTPLFLNGVAGLGSPFWVSNFRSRWLGDGSLEEKVAAVGESIAFLLQVNLDAMGELLPTPAQLYASGGLTRADSLCQRLADLSGLPVHRPAEHEATARGLGFLAADRPASWQPSGPGTQFSPRSNAALTERYQRWREALCRELTDYPGVIAGCD